MTAPTASEHSFLIIYFLVMLYLWLIYQIIGDIGEWRRQSEIKRIAKFMADIEEFDQWIPE